MQWPRIQIRDIADNQMVRQLWSFFPAVYGATLISYRHISPFHQILTNIKYQGHTELAVKLGRWGANEFASTDLPAWTDVVVPVPLSRWKALRRGYNQARLIAQGIAQEYQRPVADWLKRKGGSKSTQTHLTAEERLENVRNVFSARIPEKCRGKHILLVDDVMTTGATLTACALAILREDPTAALSVFTIALSR